MLRRRNFWLCFIWAIILSAAGLAIINESTTYASAFVGGDLTRAAALAGIVSIANGVGRVLSGQLFDVKGYRTAMLGVSVLYLAAAGALTLSLKTGSVPVLAAALFADRVGIRRCAASELRLYCTFFWPGALCGEFQYYKYESDRRILSWPCLWRRQLWRHISGHRRFCHCRCGDYPADPETGAALIPDRRVFHECL